MSWFGQILEDGFGSVQDLLNSPSDLVRHLTTFSERHLRSFSQEISPRQFAKAILASPNDLVQRIFSTCRSTELAQALEFIEAGEIRRITSRITAEELGSVINKVNGDVVYKIFENTGSAELAQSVAYITPTELRNISQRVLPETLGAVLARCNGDLVDKICGAVRSTELANAFATISVGDVRAIAHRIPSDALAAIIQNSSSDALSKIIAATGSRQLGATFEHLPLERLAAVCEMIPSGDLGTVLQRLDGAGLRTVFEGIPPRTIGLALNGLSADVVYDLCEDQLNTLPDSRVVEILRPLTKVSLGACFQVIAKKTDLPYPAFMFADANEITDILFQTVTTLLAFAVQPLAATIAASYIAYLESQATLRQLPEEFKSAAREHFSGRNAHTGAFSIDDVRYAENVNTQLGGTAVTIGNHIFFPGEMNVTHCANNEVNIRWMLHEITHCEQYHQRGGVASFLAEYVVQIASSIISSKTFNVHDILPLEQEADDRAARVLPRVCEHLG